MTRMRAVLVLTALCAVLAPPARPDDLVMPEMVIKPDQHPQYDAPTIKAFMARARKKFVNGDICAARLLLKPAANDGDPEAARLIAETFDQVWLIENHVIGNGLADFDLAVFWYKRAAELGDVKPGNRYTQAMEN